MTNSPRPRRPGRRPQGSLTHLITHSDPIALVGISLALVVSVCLDVTGAASGVESLLAGLMLTILSLVLDASARAERRFQLRQLVQTTDWLAGSVTSVAAATQRIVGQYPGGAIEDEARQRLRRLVEEFDDLSRGRIERPGDDGEHLLAATRACRERLEAVTNVADEPTWWRGDVGTAYWQANLDALARGVRITRVFLTDQPSSELEELMERQRQAGVEVIVKRRDQDPGLHVNIVVWDGRQAWEARMNAHGETVAHLFMVNEQDVSRRRELFRRLVLAGR
ncbi:hypothetical protein [Streptomyces sp. XD-27]|uniref:hypothetical protein n=1 Tax=Streptomyces sp. XD-27 TaxID=3062779 RepID=UPI0026F436BB|nr:hypothetical protein [Streptomyces sp. XD-27]WKX70211.1 hypothetical protein Q3Y56_10030 [Streptomyces sp. XD-27]